MIEKIYRFILENIGKKFNNIKLRFFLDFVFIYIEKIIPNFDILLHYYLDFYEDMVNLEVEMADISNNKKILHIGCGSIPATAILLAKKTNNSVTAIDNDSSSISKAKKCINFFNLKNKISIIYSDGYDFSIKNFDIVILSLGINPGYKIMERISNLITKDIKVIYRTSSNFEGELSDYDSFLNNFFKIEKIIHHKNNGLLISVLLSKKN